MPSCRHPSCDEPARGRGPRVDGFAAKFCSPECELKYEHVKADAQDARRAAEEQAAEEERWP